MERGGFAGSLKQTSCAILVFVIRIAGDFSEISDGLSGFFVIFRYLAANAFKNGIPELFRLFGVKAHAEKGHGLVLEAPCHGAAR